MSDADERRASLVLLARWPSLRAVRAVPLRPDDHDLRAQSFQGPEGGLTFPMHGVSLHWFAQALGGARHGRHRRGVPPLAARSALVGDGAHRGALAARPGSPSASASRRRTLLFYVDGREPDHAVDRRLARHRPASSACSTTRVKALLGSARLRPTRSRATPPRWACSPPASARTSPGRCRSAC